VIAIELMRIRTSQIEIFSTSSSEISSVRRSWSLVVRGEAWLASVCACSPHRLRLAGLATGGAEQWAVRVAGDAGGGDIVVEKLFQAVVTGDFVLLAAFLVQSDPAAPSLAEIVLHLHAEDRVDAGEAVDHDADQGAVAETGERAGVDGLQHSAQQDVYRMIQRRAAAASSCRSWASHHSAKRRVALR
jgi:hypothetical protein